MTYGSNSKSRFGRYALLTALLFTAPATFSQAAVYYRYIDEHGVQVLDDKVPPQYVQKGYEVVSLSGEVIRRVEPAPDAEALARREAEARLRNDYQRLKRRYSSLADIEAARDRRLENIETNIAILEGNIIGLENQIRSLTGEAADLERQGRNVPERLVKKLEDVRAELAVAEERLAARLREQDATVEKFAADMETYAKGRELTEKTAASR